MKSIFLSLIAGILAFMLPVSMNAATNTPQHQKATSAKTKSAKTKQAKKRAPGAKVHSGYIRLNLADHLGGEINTEQPSSMHFISLLPKKARLGRLVVQFDDRRYKFKVAILDGLYQQPIKMYGGLVGKAKLDFPIPYSHSIIIVVEKRNQGYLSSGSYYKAELFVK